jgi:hypothetical protein
MKDDEKLRNVLKLKIIQINKEKSRIGVKEVAKIMAAKYNVDHGRTTYIFNNNEPIEKVSYNMLYKLMDSIKIVINSKYSNLFSVDDLNWKTYFYETEKVEYEKPFPEQDEKCDFITKDFHIINMGHYQIVTIYPSIDEVYKMNSYNKFHYNPETQRDLITEEVDGMPIVKLDINWKSIKEMKEAMKKGKYFPVTGIININPEENDETYYFRGEEFIVPDNVRMDLCEGFHNLIAETQVKEEMPDWQFPCRFDIVCMNKENINNVIRQMDRKNHFNEAQIAIMDTSEISYLINTLSTSSKFHLNGICDKEIFLFLYKLIPGIFTIGDSRRQTTQLVNLFISNLNYVIEITDHFDKSFTREEWFIYLYLLKLSKENNVDYQTVIDSIDINILLNEVKFKSMPLRKHYEILNKSFKEVSENVL